MLNFLLADINLIFSIAIGIVLTLGFIELLGLLTGFSLMGLVDDISPVEIDASVDAPTSGGFSQTLSWLCLDRLPLLIWLILFLTSFGIIGYLINAIALNIFNVGLPILVSIPSALIAAVIVTARTGSVLAQMMPKTDSSATDQEQFSGMVATITLGKAQENSPAEAKFSDSFDQTHYVMVEPMDSNQIFNQGDKVILVNKGKRGWMATAYK
jgi:hypothetical protein